MGEILSKEYNRKDNSWEYSKIKEGILSMDWRIWENPTDINTECNRRQKKKF